MTGKIKGFDGIRGLAVISVVLTHLNVWEYLQNHGLHSSVIPMLHGSTGVQWFFVLSGFLITSLLISEYRTTGTISLKNFFMRRTLRIFPLYIVFLFIATVLSVVDRNVTTGESLTYAYLYIYNFVPAELYTSFIGHTWSLAVEEHFYLIWPPLFLLMFARHRSRLFLLLCLSIPASVLLYYALIHSHFNQNYFIDRWSMVAGYNIAAGCLASLLVHSGKLASWARPLFKIDVALLVGVALYANAFYLSTGSWFIDEIGGQYVRAAGIVLIVLWIFLNQESLFVKVLEITPLAYLGLISYGVYVFQGLFLATGPQREAGATWPLDPAIGFVLLIIAAPLSYHFFEQPFLKLKHRFARKAVTHDRPGTQSRTHQTRHDEDTLARQLQTLAHNVYRWEAAIHRPHVRFPWRSPH